MGIFDLFGKKEGPISGTIYTLTAEMHPLRLAAHKNDYAQLNITLRNDFEKEQLTSLVISLPKTLGFDRSALNNQRKIRLGQLQPGETKTQQLEVWATQRTGPGLYPVKIYAISHFRDYGAVLNEVRKQLAVRVA